jgi:hypothetical protein
MTGDEIMRFVVQLRADPLPGREAAEGTQQGLNRLVDELYKMGVRQVRFL